ncbi:MAG: type 2 lanthipeptide synthetase LanM family protein, partial [Gammaproteobacteria bacterium]
MNPISATGSFGLIIDHILADARKELSYKLGKHRAGLGDSEIELIRVQAEAALHESAQLKLNRLLLLELHAAMRGGLLTANDDPGRMAQFVELARSPEFSTHLDQRYPVLRHRLHRMLRAQCHAFDELASRIAAERHRLANLLGRPAGQLIALSPGKGDLHSGGRTVARVSFEGGLLMYKPRSLRIDAELDGFLESVFGRDIHRVRVPAVVDQGSHGWAAFAAHRYCNGDDELRTYYRGLGHWLAVLRLIGGTDVHLENLIAVGPVPVVVDAESVFSASIEAEPSGYGKAYDVAVNLMRNSVLRTGIVPFRTAGLGLEGVDLSAAGALPGEQPRVRVPVIVEDDTTQARLGLVDADFATSQNHPCPNPDLSQFWDEISNGFMEASSLLRSLDSKDRLMPLLARFDGCQVRDVRRPTMAYAEIGRMLWHPASLHDEDSAVARAFDLLIRNAAVAPAAPSEPEQVMKEIDDLRYGDIPIFVSVLDRARIEATVANWRAMRIDLEEVTIRSTLVATDLNQHALARAEARSGYSYAARNPHGNELEVRRRRLAAGAVENLIRLSVRGEDGTMTWITPEITRTGWTVQPVRADLYFGLGGIAFSLAGYWREVQQGRADEVEGLQDAMEGAIRILLTMSRLDEPKVDGGFVGAGSQIWALISLYDMLGRKDLLEQATHCAESMERRGFDQCDKFEVLDGISGVIVPLLCLVEATGKRRWLDLAAQAARRLEAAAIVDEKGARWPTPQFDEPIGGFAHGAMGIAWSLARLSLTEAGTEEERRSWSRLAYAAFDFQDALYEEATGRWRDIHLKDGQKNFPTWCHGSVGIGLASADLYARTRKPQHLRDL